MKKGGTATQRGKWNGGWTHNGKVSQKLEGRGNCRELSQVVPFIINASLFGDALRQGGQNETGNSINIQTRLFKGQIGRNDDASRERFQDVAAVFIDVFFVNLRLRIARKLTGNVIVAEENEGWFSKDKCKREQR